MSAMTRRLTNNATKTGGTGTGTWRFDFSEEAKEGLGIDFAEFDFTDSPTNLVDVHLEFLFDAPAETFVLDGKVLFCGSYLLDGWTQGDGVNGTGTLAGNSFFFSTDEAFESFVAEFLADKRIEMITPY